MMNLKTATQNTPAACGTLRRRTRVLAAAPLLSALLLASSAFGAAHALAQTSPLVGVYTCIQGFVWRQVVPSDHVCVTPETRSKVVYDNSQAAARRSTTDQSYGPDTCLQGFVWREAVPGDHVCVTPDVRSQTADDNSQAASRTVLGAVLKAVGKAPDLALALDGKYADDVTFVVRNQGTAASAPFRIGVIGDKGFLDHFDDPGLAAGESRLYHFRGGTPKERLTIVADFGNTVGDSDTSNNILVVQLSDFGYL